MTIKNMDDYIRNLWNWNCLAGCFGDSGISPTDIDGFVERNGRFLVIETKSPGTELLAGQALAFDRLAKLRQFTVVVVWGKPEEVEELQVWGKGVRHSANTDTLRLFVESWFDDANERR